MEYNIFFKKEVDKIREENRYRKFRNVSREVGKFPVIYSHDIGDYITLWCSNDYLGMGHNEQVIQEFVETAQKMGIGAGGTRNISGSHNPLFLLEKEIANMHQKEAGLVFNSGYSANEGALAVLGKIFPSAVIISDQNNHASMIEGIKKSRLEKAIFKHNDLNDLEKILKKIDLNRPKIIAFESVYSMDGSISPIKEIINLAKKYYAFTYIDEVHAVGLYGNEGGGISQELGLSNDLDIIQGTFGKAYGAMGGYIVAKEEIIDAIRLKASPFIFSTSMPPALVMAILKSVQILRSDEGRKLREKLMQNTKLLKEKLALAKIDFLSNNSHIIPVMIRSAEKSEKISDLLLKNYKIYAQNINFPTVEKGTERLRITLSPYHKSNQMDELIEALIAVL